MTVFFTADHHFGHKNIIKFCNRPFSSVDEMDEVLINNWNDVVSKGDIVYHLGDFTLLDINRFGDYISYLNGIIYIVPGGHDHRWLKDFWKEHEHIRSRTGSPVGILDSLYSVKFPELSDTKYPQVIALCHYAMRVWDRSHYGTWHLYGHSHGNLPGKGLSFDIGVDAMAYYPISLSEVAKRMEEIKL